MEVNEVIRIAEFIFGLLGGIAEVVVHDISEDKIIWIKNGEITNRKVGDDGSSSAIRILYETCRNGPLPGMLLGYHSKSTETKTMRSSNLFFKDIDGNVRYVICVNEDQSLLIDIRNYCNVLLQVMPQYRNLVLPDEFDARFIQEEEHSFESIESLTKNLILSEITREKPFSLDSKEAKMNILRRLNDRGVFEVKQSMSTVSQLLNTPTPTLYKYVREIKAEKKTE